MERKIADTNNVEVYTAAVTVPDLGLDPMQCAAPGRADPCIIVIMGATGDLTSRKLSPALFDLYRNWGMRDRFLIVGCGRSEIDSQESYAYGSLPDFFRIRIHCQLSLTRVLLYTAC